MLEEPKLKLLFGLTEKQMLQVHEELIRYNIGLEIYSLLEWHCEGCSDEYCEELYSLFDLDKATKEGMDMWFKGCDDLSYIKDDIFSRYILSCEKQMKVKE